VRLGMAASQGLSAIGAFCSNGQFGLLPVIRWSQHERPLRAVSADEI
jgi:hypothetical protein